MPELNVLDYGVSEGAEAVVLAYDTELTYEKLTHAALLLQNPEVAYLATHPDLVCPSPQGPLPDAGSFMSLFETATGRRPQHIFGKPDPAVLGTLLQSYDRKDMVMVGDRLSTDKKLAENAGIDFILVLSQAQRPARPRTPAHVGRGQPRPAGKRIKRNTIPSIRTGEDSCTARILRIQKGRFP